MNKLTSVIKVHVTNLDDWYKGKPGMVDGDPIYVGDIPQLRDEGAIMLILVNPSDTIIGDLRL